MAPDNNNRKLHLTSWLVRAVFRQGGNSYYAELEKIAPAHTGESPIGQRADAPFRQSDRRSFDLMVGG